METTIRPYCTTSNDQHDLARSRFVRSFSELFFSTLEDDQEYQRICQISDKLNTKSKEFLVKALRSSLSFDFISRQENKYQVILKIKLNKIKDEFASGMDNAVVAASRRKPDGSSSLRLISEIHELSGNLAWSFNLDTTTNTISYLRPVNAQRRDIEKRLPQMVVETLNKLEQRTESERANEEKS